MTTPYSPTYTRSAMGNFDEKKAYASIIGGTAAYIMEDEVNEMQWILSQGRAKELAQLTSSGFFGKGTDSVSSGTLTVGARDAVVGGHRIRMQGTAAHSGNLVLTLPTGPASGTRTDLVYLVMYMQAVSPASSLTAYGYLSGDAITNDMLDSRIGADTSHRVQKQWTVQSASGQTSLTALGYTATSYDANLYTKANGTTVDGVEYAIPLYKVVRTFGSPDTLTDAAYYIKNYATFGQANGLATLDINAHVPSAQLPVATTGAIGGVKASSSVTVAADGTLGVSLASAGAFPAAGGTITGETVLQFASPDLVFQDTTAGGSRLRIVNVNGVGLRTDHWNGTSWDVHNILDDGTGRASFGGSLFSKYNTLDDGVTGAATFAGRINASGGIAGINAMSHAGALNALMHFESALLTTRGVAGTFTRASAANNGDTLATLANNAPSYVNGKFGKGVSIWEGTTNLVQNSDFEAFTATATVFSDPLTSGTAWTAQGGSFTYAAGGATSGALASLISAGNSAWKPLAGSGGQNLALTAQATYTTPSTMPVSGHNLSLLEMRQDASDYYYVAIDETANTFVLGKSVAGVGGATLSSVAFTPAVSTAYTMTLSRDINGLMTAKLYSGTGTGGTLLQTLTATDTSLSGGFLIGVGGDTGVVISAASVAAPWANSWGTGGDTRVAWALTATSPISGSYSMSATGFAGLATSPSPFGYITRTLSGFATSASYTISGYIATTNVGPNGATIYSTANSTSIIPTKTFGTTSATRTTAMGTSGATSGTCGVTCVIYDSGTAVFDAIQLEQKSYATPYLRNDSTSASATRAAETLTYPATLLNAAAGTISVWAYESQQASNHYLLDTGGNVSTYRFLLTNGGTSYSIFMNGAVVISGIAQASVGWHLFTVKWSGTNLTFYIDGVSKSTVTLGSAVTFSGLTSLYIGCSSAGALQWNGAIDELAIFNRALTDAEVYSLYAATQPLIDVFATAFGSNVVDDGSGNAIFRGNITGTGANQAVELGSTSTAGTPFIDFHSSGSGNDYDARIIASGGDPANVGRATLQILGGSIHTNNNTIDDGVGHISTPYTGGLQIGATADLNGNAFALEIAAPVGTNAWPIGVMAGGGTSAQRIFAVNNSNEVLTLHNTLDDGAGASTFVGTVGIHANVSGVAGSEHQFSQAGTHGFYVNDAGLGVYDWTNARGVFSYDPLSYATTFLSHINVNNGMTLSSVAPILTFYESDQAVDEKDWWVVPDAKQFQIRAVNDAETTNVIAMNIIRGTGTAITSVNFPSGALYSSHNTLDDGSGGAVFAGVVKMATGSMIKGNGIGATNAAWLGFYESDGVTRKGFVGDGSAGDTNIALYSDVGDVLLQTAAGGVGLTLSQTNGLYSKHNTLDDGTGIAAFTGTMLTISAPGSTNQEERFHLYNGGGVAEWKFGQKSGTSHDFILSKVVANADSDYLTVHAGDGTATFSGRGEFGTAVGGEALDIKAGGTNDHVYMGFYARSATQSVRSGYMGYPSQGTTTLMINNELNAPIELVSTNVLVNALKGRQSILQIDSGGGDLQIGSPGGNVGITDGTHSSWKFSYNTALDHLEANVPITFDSLATFNQGITVPGGNIELGSETSVQTPFIDFHSTGSSNDYDARIICSGGVAGSPSQGGLNLIGGAIQANGNTVLHRGNVVTSLNQSGYISIPSSAGTRIEQTLFWQATSQTFSANTSYSFTANLPLTFPTTILIVVGSISGGWVNNGYNSVIVRRLSNSQVQISLLFGVTWTGAPSVEVIAIGY